MRKELNRTMDQLRNDNMEVKVEHLRLFKNGEMMSRRDFEAREEGQSYGDSVSSRGGLTRVTVTTPEGKVATGESRCSDKEVFNQKRGYKMALGRALKSL